MSHLSMIILAKDEESSIRQCLERVAAQDLLHRSDEHFEILVVPNGCTDNTAAAAEEAGSIFANLANVDFKVVDLPEGGKARSWNRAVHELSKSDTDFFIFLDADIVLANDHVLSGLLEHLRENENLAVISGNPVKDTVRKRHQTLFERLSLAASRESNYVNVVNGSCYVGRAARLREIWLPNDTPGEDGFLNAMVTTENFKHKQPVANVLKVEEPTHFYEAEGAITFYHHEKRMVIGTMINRWIFEHLHAADLDGTAGEWIRKKNAENPSWIDDLIGQRVKEDTWLIPPSLLFRRLTRRGDQDFLTYLSSLPLRVAATIASVPSFFAANKALKQRGVARYW